MQSTDRQFGIWRSRVFREFDKCAQLENICPGATLYELFVDEPQGIAIARFHLFVPFREGSSALCMIPLTALEVAMHFDTQRSALGEPQFPFCAPRVSVYQGATYLPRELRYTCATTGKVLLELPTLAHWSPSNTLVMILQDVVTAVQLSDPQPAASTSASDGVSSGAHGQYGAHGTSGKPGKRLRMRKRDIYGAIYHCHEVDPRSGMLRPVPMLLQSGNIVLLMPAAPASASSKAAAAAAQRAGQALPADDDHVFVSDLFPLKDIARITPQRGKSITFFFKSQHMHCRTLLTPQTEAIVADIQRMIAAVGSKRAREDDASSHHDRSGNHHTRSHHSNSGNGGGSGQDDGALAQLMSYLSPEHTEKAKEVSNKIVGKLSRWGSTVSRFFKGDDDGDVDMGSPTSTTTANRPRTAALLEIDRLKTQFFQYPSRAKMLEITTRYQQVAETLAQHNSRDGQVEKTIEEMQAFIEHPATQKLLLEAYAVDNSQRGIRVGSL